MIILISRKRTEKEKIFIIKTIQIFIFEIKYFARSKMNCNFIITNFESNLLIIVKKITCEIPADNKAFGISGGIGSREHSARLCKFFSLSKLRVPPPTPSPEPL